MPFLIPDLCLAQQVLHLANVPEIWAVAKAAEDLNGNPFRRLRGG